MNFPLCATAQRRLSLRGEQQLLKAFDELRDMQAIYQGVMRVDRDGHGAASVRVSDLAEGDPRCRVNSCELPCVGDGGEVEPGKHGEADQVVFRKALDIVALFYFIDLERSFVYELLDPFAELIVAEADGAVRSADRAAAMDLVIAPHLTVDDAGLEVLHQVRGDE